MSNQVYHPRCIFEYCIFTYFEKGVYLNVSYSSILRKLQPGFQSNKSASSSLRCQGMMLEGLLGRLNVVLS